MLTALCSMFKVSRKQKIWNVNLDVERPTALWKYKVKSAAIRLSTLR